MAPKADRLQPLKRQYHGGLWNRFFVAGVTSRLALPWSWLFARIRMTPNQVSLLSFFLAMAGALLLGFGPAGFGARLLGAFVMILSLVFDHADGQVARRTGRSSLKGGLLDSYLDRWVEALWIGALGVGALRTKGPGPLGDSTLAVALATLAALHGSWYFRYAHLSRKLTIVRKELQAARLSGGDPEHFVVNLPPGRPARPAVRTFYLPFHFERDAILWVLFAVSLTPWWAEGLAGFAVLLTLRGLEINWYAFRDLDRRTDAVHRVLDRDFH